MCSDHQGWDQVGMVSSGIFNTIVIIGSVMIDHHRHHHQHINTVIVIGVKITNFIITTTAIIIIINSDVITTIILLLSPLTESPVSSALCSDHSRHDVACNSSEYLGVSIGVICQECTVAISSLSSSSSALSSSSPKLASIEL